jgi:hypothetical protein
LYSPCSRLRLWRSGVRPGAEFIIWYVAVKEREAVMTSNGESRPIRIGISQCLLGEQEPFDGGHKLDRFITKTLGQYFEWVPVCPEVELGLETPR